MPRKETTGDESIAPFGEKTRRRLIARYFESNGIPDVEQAWLRVYGLLLWIDSSTGLAHCYESDKCQPGKPWYARSLAFHRWLASSLGTNEIKLKESLDWLFHNALEAYLAQVAKVRDKQQAKGDAQRNAYAGTLFPLPGVEPELERILIEGLKPYFASIPPPEVIEQLTRRLRDYWKQENKRKNLLGEGFEDVLSAVIAAVHPGLKVRARASVADIAGFYAPGAKDKATKVDLVVEHPKWSRPTLINVKWSIRADREDQLWDDFQEYVRFDRDGRGFDHYILTNEFDPARLNALCERRQANSHVFKQVVHMSTHGVLAAYGLSSTRAIFNKAEKGNNSFQKVLQQIQTGRLVSLAEWLKNLNQPVDTGRAKRVR